MLGGERSYGRLGVGVGVQVGGVGGRMRGYNTRRCVTYSSKGGDKTTMWTRNGLAGVGPKSTIQQCSHAATAGPRSPRVLPVLIISHAHALWNGRCFRQTFQTDSGTADEADDEDGGEHRVEVEGGKGPRCGFGLSTSSSFSPCMIVV